MERLAVEAERRVADPDALRDARETRDAEAAAGRAVDELARAVADAKRAAATREAERRARAEARDAAAKDLSLIHI